MTKAKNNKLRNDNTSDSNCIDFSPMSGNELFTHNSNCNHMNIMHNSPRTKWERKARGYTSAVKPNSASSTVTSVCVVKTPAS